MSTTQHSNEPVDVVVIGSGVGGAITSMILAEKGLKVVCLEQGDWVDDHPHGDPGWEYRRFTDWALFPNERHRDSDYPLDTRDEKSLMWNGVGGSTNLYTATWPRFRPSDFRKGTEHGLAPDWPIAYEDLAEFYDRSDVDCGVGGFPGDPSMPQRGPFQTAPCPRGDMSRHAARGFDELGWHWWPMPTAIIAEDYRDRNGCNNCGYCLASCPTGALAGMHVTHWPRALAAGAELRTNARVARIETDADGKATGATYIDRSTGDRRFQAAKVVVLAGNGVGTPRVLLMSDSAAHPNGLANSSDQVGRNLMHHVLAFVEMWLDAPTENHMGTVGATLISAEFAETDVSRGFVNGTTLHLVRQLGAGIQSLGSNSGNRAPWGRGHHDWFRRHFSHGLSVLVYGDDLPQAENRVTLSDELRDSSGLPGAKIDYKLCANDRRLIEFGIERAKDLGRALGAFEMKTNDFRDAEGNYVPNAWHLYGTARMGDDPNTSVVNPWHQAWDCPNLFVIDGSVMVTGAAVNPTSTIAALSYRAAENLAARFEDACEGRSFL